MLLADYSSDEHCFDFDPYTGVYSSLELPTPRTDAAAPKESTMTSQLQPTTPTPAPPRAADEDPAIRPFPFQIRLPEAELVELRRRIVATRWPEKETVADHSQGVPLAMVRELARYWATDYDHTDADGQPAAAVASALSRTSSATGELTRDEILDTVTLYWLTNTGVSLQQGRQGRPLRRVGAAPALRGRGARGVPIAPLTV